jgi:hypothetical protein
MCVTRTLTVVSLRPGSLDHNGAVPDALPERAYFEDNPLGYDAFRVEWLSQVLL